MKLITKETLDPSELEAVFELWNSEYPSTISFGSLEDMKVYIEALGHPLHHIILDQNDAIVAWCFVFDREKSRWFGMMVKSELQGQGLGTTLLNNIQAMNDQLSGWAVESDYYKKSDGSNYRSPLSFYTKHDFKIMEDVRFDSDRLSTVKISWRRL